MMTTNVVCKSCIRVSKKAQECLWQVRLEAVQVLFLRAKHLSVAAKGCGVNCQNFGRPPQDRAGPVGLKSGMTTYRPRTPHSDFIFRPDCPKCAKRMNLFRIEPEKPSYELRTFVCPKCNHSETAIGKSG